MAGILTTNGEIILAVRAHHNQEGGNSNLPSYNERRGQTIICIESARLWAGGNVDVALDMRDQLEGMTDAQFWQHQFILHPTQMQFVHHALV